MLDDYAGQNGVPQIDPAREKQLRAQAEAEARRRIDLDKRVLELQETLCAGADAQLMVIAVCDVLCEWL